jgi:pimeloyl-ACP methyl ester carboxylesterase
MGGDDRDARGHSRRRGYAGLGRLVAASRTIHEQIQGSELVILKSASHLSNMEQPEAFNRL